MLPFMSAFLPFQYSVLSDHAPLNYCYVMVTQDKLLQPLEAV